MNVTPLVDVTLVLLIIFMVVAPAINEGEQVELPRIDAVDEKRKDLNPIEMTVAANGNVVLNKERIAPAELRPRLSELYRAEPGRQLMLKTDSGIPYQRVREHFAILQDIGFRGVQLKVVARDRSGQNGS